MSFLQAKECPQRNLHCEVVPDDDEHYDEHIEMESPDIEPPPKVELPLEVTVVDDESSLSFTGAF